MKVYVILFLLGLFGAVAVAGLRRPVRWSTGHQRPVGWSTGHQRHVQWFQRQLAGNCPAEWFDASFSFFTDVQVSSFGTPDPELRFFREVVKLTENEIEQIIQDALEHFHATYGLDFYQSEPDTLGRRYFENAVFFPAEVPLTYNISSNNWLLTGVEGLNRCFQVKVGPFYVVFTGEQILRGTYGGEEGRVVPISDGMSYDVFYILTDNPIIMICTTLPIFRNVDGYAPLVGDCYIDGLGEGLLLGANHVNNDSGRIVIRYVFSFPSHPGDF